MDIRERARLFVAAFNRRDVRGMQELVTDDFTLVPVRAAVEDVSYAGKDAIARWMADLAESWAEFEIELDDMQETRPGVLLVFGRMTGRGRGTGAPFEAHGAWIGRERDGLLSSLETFTDRAAAIRAAAG